MQWILLDLHGYEMHDHNICHNPTALRKAKILSAVMLRSQGRSQWFFFANNFMTSV